MYRMMMFGKWLLIGTLIFHVLNANYVINQYAARVESLEIAIKRLDIEVRAPRVNGAIRMDKTDQAILDQLTKSDPTSTPPMSDAERSVLGRGIH
jgi:hypothetical protein